MQALARLLLMMTMMMIVIVVTARTRMLTATIKAMWIGRGRTTH